ncbi:MAG: FmdB family transcriptional regulator [Acidimicrobiia bacterium BACL6 MAG-120910-bin40]|jgi:predicted nucleic acid-binding Zn ribbon protein|nr:MAG: FmdB family transcriptional regulator [Acidimicrobiia bacterium BACL6 MAG-120910-bin40]
MPTYVYKFIDSGETIEVYQAFTDDPLTELAHPQDGVVKPVKKVFTPVGVSFKGGGFYKTDSKSTSSSTTPASTSPTSTGTSAPAASENTTAAPAAAPAAVPAAAPASTPAS